MALTLRVFTTPAAVRVSTRVGRGLWCVGVPVSFENRDGFRSMRCSTEDSKVENAVWVEKKDAAVHAEPSFSHLYACDGSSGDKFGGWYGVEIEVEKNSLKIAAMQVATGFLLALGVSLSSFVLCRKLERRGSPSSPSLTQMQLPSVLKSSLHASEHYDHKEDLNEESEENRDQEKAADGVKDESQDSASEPGAESTSAQVDRMSTSVSSKNEVRLSAAQSAPESEKSRQDTNKTHKKPQPAVLQPRMLRKSQQNKRKASVIQDRRRKVVMPAVVDRIQEQILAVLQTLKVVEEGSDPRTICKRREYVRWIIASSSTLTRSSAYKVFPAMYMEGVTELAFGDVAFNDPDFKYIQGLAEAGLVPSSFSLTNGEDRKGAYDCNSEGINFFPDSPVSRLDLVSWKIALGRRSLPVIDKEALQAKSGFLDVDRIESTLLPALSVDLDYGENSIIMSAFGRTRRFQPDKAATIGQAAIALACGDSSEVFSEELARFQAETMAQEAVVADDKLQAQKQKDLNAFFDGKLSTERQQKEQAQKSFEELKAEFEKVKTERDAEKDVLMKDKAAVQSEKELLQHLREQVDEQLQALSMRVMQVSVKLEKLEQLRINSEVDDEELSKLMSEVGVGKQALVQARLWAKDEARQARTHAEALESTRKQMASRELLSSSVDAFDEDSIPARRRYRSGTKARTELENFLQGAPLQHVMLKGEDLKVNVSNALIQSWLTLLRVLNCFLLRVGDRLRDVRLRTQHYYIVTSSSTGNLLQALARVLSQKFQNLQVLLSEFSSRVGDETKKFAFECKKVSRRLENE